MTYQRESRPGGNSGKKYGKKAFGAKKFGERSFGGAGGYGERGGFRDSSKPVMHQAVCSECDKECEVPFRPSGEKPVFCRNCFRSKGDTGTRDFGERSFRPSIDKGNDQLKTVNAKLDKILDILESLLKA